LNCKNYNAIIQEYGERNNKNNTAGADMEYPITGNQ
jgi:hypothetical protein